MDNHLKNMSFIPNPISMLFMGTADKTISNTNAETSAIPTGSGTTILPANWWTVGRMVRVRGHGVYTTPAITGGTATVKVKLGSTVIASVSTTALLVGASGAAFDLEVVITCRSVGASGSVVIGGNVNYQVGAGSRVFDNLDNGGAAVTVDTTVAQTVDVTVTWDTASASKVTKTVVARIETF